MNVCAATLPPGPAPVPVPVSVPPTRALGWLGRGLRLWRQAPIALLLLALAPFGVELLLQLIPGVGVVLSKLVVPIVQAGVWIGLHEKVTAGRPLRASCLLEGFDRRRLVPLAALSVCFLSIPAIQMLVAAALYGPGAAAMVLLGGHGRPGLAGPGFILALILPGLLPGTLLMLAMPFVLFDRLGPGRAVVLSARFAWAARGAFALFTLLTAALLTVSLLGKGLPLFLVAPWLFVASYAAYRDLKSA